jgi:RNA polymerase sigma factor (TIGR02999 family)
MSEDESSSPKPGTSDDESLTLLLAQARAGDEAALTQAWKRLYPELRRIARARLRAHQAPTLLDTQGLVHESYLRLARAAPTMESRKHFYAYASQAMRHILVDFVRRREAERRGGALQRVTLDTAALNAAPAAAVPMLDVEQALIQLESLDPALAQVVELRYFGGYTDSEIAEALGISERSVRRQWEKARAFLLAHLENAP